MLSGALMVSKKGFAEKEIKFFSNFIMENKNSCAYQYNL